MNDDFNGVLRFECFELHAVSGDLLRDGVRVPIQFQPFKLLMYFALHPDQIISRETLRAHLWSHHTFVDFEAGLNFCIRQVRKALGEDARAPRLLHTLNRRGYKFTASVKRENADAPQFTAEANGIRVTLISQPSMATDRQAMERLAEVISQLVLASSGNLVSTPGQTSPVSTPVVPHANPQVSGARGLEVRIHRNVGEERMPALRAG